MEIFDKNLQNKTANFVQMKTTSGYFSLIVGSIAAYLLFKILFKCVEELGDFGFLKNFAHYLGY